MCELYLRTIIKKLKKERGEKKREREPKAQSTHGWTQPRREAAV